MENKELREQISKLMPQLESQFWSYYNSACTEMGKVVWTRIHPNIRKSQPMAFCARSRRTTGVFEIYVNPYVPYEVIKPFELHEFGHVIFTHMSLMNNQREILIQKIMSHWSKFEGHLDDSILKSSDVDIKKAAQIICNAILNIAMDYEVNSKLFTDDEWKTFVDYTQWAFISASIGSESTTNEELVKIQEWITSTEQNKKLLFQPCWPVDSGFPKGLDYKQYVDLMLMKPDNAMDALKKALNNQQGQGGSSDGQDGSNGSGEGNFKISKTDLEKLKEQQSDANSDASNDAIDKAQEQDDEENGTSGGGQRQKNNISGWGLNEGKQNEDVIDVTDNKALKSKLLKEVINKHILLCRQDNMYYYNRQKYQSNLLVSKTKDEDIYRPGNVYLLVDCSGSIGTNSISAIIGVVKDIAKKCGPKSRIIWWDTRCEGDFLLKEMKGPKGCGGTEIGGGIRYVRENYLKKNNDKLIVISDYCDALNCWLDELSKIKKNDCIGICWGNFKDHKNPTEWLKNSCITYDNDDTMYKGLIKKLPTTFVNVSSDFDL